MPAMTRSMTSLVNATTQLTTTPLGMCNISIRTSGGVYIKIADSNPNYTTAPGTGDHVWYIDPSTNQSQFMADPSKVWVFGAAAVYAVIWW